MKEKKQKTFALIRPIALKAKGEPTTLSRQAALLAWLLAGEALFEVGVSLPEISSSGKALLAFLIHLFLISFAIPAVIQIGNLSKRTEDMESKYHLKIEELERRIAEAEQKKVL